MDGKRPLKDSAAGCADHSPPADAEVKSGVTLPRNVSLLRWKPGHQAKQQPKFRFDALSDRVYRPDVLTAAWRLVLKNNGAAGVDGISCQDIIDGPGADFPGFTFRYDRDLYRSDRRYLNVFPSKKSVARARDQLRDPTATRRCFLPATAVTAEVTRWPHSWGNYFRHGYPRKAFREVNNFARLRLTRHGQRRSQRPLPPAGRDVVLRPPASPGPAVLVNAGVLTACACL